MGPFGSYRRSARRPTLSYTKQVTPPIEQDVPLAPFTTFGIGGPADLLTKPQTVDELAAAVSWAKEQGHPWFVLGTGANILIGDGGFRGLVIKNEASAVSFEGKTLTAESGVTIAKLISETTKRGLSGLEHFINIPSSLGGAMWQNLHFLSPDRSRTVFIAELVRGAEILDERGKRRQVEPDYFQFGYDTSSLHETDDVVLTVTMELTESTPEAIREISQANVAWRAEKHPPGAERMSAGSIFQKIEGIGAGRLIDQAGLKGYTIGGAQVSDHHANYILNVGGATAADVRALITHTQAVVEESSGQNLTPEISFVGEF